MTEITPPTQAEIAADCRRELRMVESRLIQVDGALHVLLSAVTGPSPCDLAKVGRMIELLQHVAQDTQPLLWQTGGLLSEWCKRQGGRPATPYVNHLADCVCVPPAPDAEPSHYAAEVEGGYCD